MTLDRGLDDVVLPSKPCPPARCTLAEWYAEAQQLDHLGLGTEDSTVADAKRVWRERFAAKHAGRPAVLALARLDWDFERIAAELGCDVEDIARTLTRSSSDDDVQRLIGVERLLRDRSDLTFAEIARRAGVAQGLVQHLAARLGIKTAHMEKLSEGGGSVYGPDVYERIRELREKGRSYAQIGAALGIERTTVSKICHRRGYKVKAIG